MMTRTMNVIEMDQLQQQRLRREAQHWLIRLTSGEATSEDARAFSDWCARSQAHRRAFAESRRLWQRIGDAASAETVPAENAPRYDRRAFLQRALLGGVAACAGGVLLSREAAWWPGAADFETAVGEQRRVQLADVAVEMNTGTRLNADISGAELAMLELLAGEAEIRASGAARQVLLRVQGGSVLAAASDFNVRADTGEVCVTCLHGSVVVDYRGENRTLMARQQLVFGADRLGQIHNADPQRVTAWQRQLLIFDDEPLSQVIAEINRYRPGRLILMNEALGRRRVQARFTLDQLPDVAQLISDAYGATLTRMPGGVVLLG